MDGQSNTKNSKSECEFFMIIFVSVVFAIKRIFSIQSFIMRHPRETMTFFFQFTDRLGTKRVVLKPNF